MDKVENNKRKEMLLIFRFWIVCVVVSVCMYGILNTIVGLGNFFVGVIIFFGGIVCFCIGLTLPGIIIGGILQLILCAILKIFGVLDSFIKFWDEFKRNFNYRLNKFINENEEKILNFIIQYVFPLIFLIGMIVFSPYDDGNRECYDRTSIDYNRQNDMKCINEKGEVKRTDYEGAKKLMGK